MQLKKLLTFLLFACSISAIYASDTNQNEANDYQWPTDKKVCEKLSHWQDLKFGVLLHWGIYSVPGIVESWSICSDDWVKRDTTQSYQQYKKWYWGLKDKFCPTKFNPEQWAKVMKDAGMKYVLFTTKHHDGFCMFNTKQTDFSIMHGAFKDNPRCDIARYVFNAFRQQNFMTGAYFSKPDWHCPYYWWDVYPTGNRNVNYNIKRYPWRWNMYKQYTSNQIKEILSNYGQIDILWLDGGWVCKENNQDIDMPSIASMARSLQPGILMVDRTIHGPYENYQTPEQNIPSKQLDYPWESCITLTDDWGWVPRPRFKSPRRIINMLSEIVAKGGCLVLGVGPTPEGVIEPESVTRLEEIGTWLHHNGKAIYNTRTTKIYNSGNIWFTADKDGYTFYAIYALPEQNKLPDYIEWEGNIPAKNSKVRLLSNSRTLKWEVENNKVRIYLPKGLAEESFAISFQM